MAESKQASLRQENHIAKKTGGKVQSNSGGTRFGGGDVLTEHFFIEAKTTTKEQQGFAIKRQYIEKMREQAFEQGKHYSALAFRFAPGGKDYYVISEDLFLTLLKHITQLEGGN